MGQSILAAMAVLAAALLVGGPALAAWRPAAAPLLTLGLAAAGALLALAALATGTAATLTLPIGLPLSPTTLALDGLSAWFVLPVAAIAAAAALAQRDRPDHAGLLPATLGGLLLALLAADGFTLTAGLAAAGLAAGLAVLAAPQEDEAAPAGRRQLGLVLLAAAALALAFALLSGDGETDFASLRQAPPDGARGAAALLVLLAAATLSGLAPLHAWLAASLAAAPVPMAAMLAGALPAAATYLVTRILFDLCGPATPAAWGVALLLAGAAGAVLGALRATLENDVKAALAGIVTAHAGLSLAGLGLALIARAADLTALAGLAMGAVLVLALAQGASRALLALAAGAVQHGAGTRRLDRLGGLVHRMPLTTAALLLAAAGVAALPPGPGFAGSWALLQAALAAPRIGGLGLQVLSSLALAAMALAAGLLAAAAIRLVGVGCLGRPRSPRASAAEEAPSATRAAMLLLAALAVLSGLFGAPLLALAGPALRLTVGAPEAPGAWWQPALLLALLTLAGLLTFAALQRLAAPGERRAPAWDGGFGDPPAWLPFGDPAAQVGGASFAHGLQRSLGPALLGAREAVDVPPPGAVRAAVLTDDWTDPVAAALRHLPAPGARLGHLLAALAAPLPLRAGLRLLALLVAVLLGAAVVLEQP